MVEKTRRVADIKCPIIFDPAAYLTWKATPQDPFRVSSGPLRGRALANFLHDMRKEGAHAVLTPTCYIGEGDVDSLDAALSGASGLSAQAILSLPLDITWATSDRVETLIEMMKETHTPKALMLGDSSLMEPGIAKEIVANLRLIASEVPRVGLFRSDLGVFDVMARSALAGSIGGSHAMRAIPPPGPDRLPGEPPEEEDQSPQVLVEELVSYLPVDVLNEQFTRNLEIPCHCRHCGGQPLSRITGRSHWKDARLHNVAVWTEWLPDLLADASPTQRQAVWARRCRRAIDAYPRFGGRGGSRLQPPASLRVWAGEPASSVAVERRLRFRLGA